MEKALAITILAAALLIGGSEMIFDDVKLIFEGKYSYINFDMGLLLFGLAVYLILKPKENDRIQSRRND